MKVNKMEGNSYGTYDLKNIAILDKLDKPLKIVKLGH